MEIVILVMQMEATLFATSKMISVKLKDKPRPKTARAAIFLIGLEKFFQPKETTNNNDV
jgi:hypothetical protein